MAFNYTEGSTADRDRLRLEIGDTDANRARFSDAELDDILVQESTVLSSAARAFEILANRTAGDFDFTADGTSFKKGSVSDRYMKLAKRLRARAKGTTTVMPLRQDAYSDNVSSEEATVSGRVSFDRGRFE